MRTEFIVSVSPKKLKQIGLERWLMETGPEWFLDYLAPNPKVRARYLMGRFDTVSASPDGEVFVGLKRNRILGVMAVERMVWDSEHFGIECGRISPYCTAKDLDPDWRSTLHAQFFEQAIFWAESRLIRLLQRRLLSVKKDELPCLENQGFRLVDQMDTLLVSLERQVTVEPPEDGLSVRFGRPSDLPDLIAMTDRSFPSSRFIYDARLRSGGNQVYTRWLENIFSSPAVNQGEKGANTRMLVCVLKQKPVGYLAFRSDPMLNELLDRRLGMIELFVVNRAYRSKGIGRFLLAQALYVLRNDGIKDVEASTWSESRGAKPIYLNAGFQPKASLFTYHRWS